MSGPRRRRRDCARVLAVAGADHRSVHLRPAFRASVRRRADVPLVRAVRGGRAAHGGAARRHRRGFSPSRRHQARAAGAASPSWPSSPASTRSRRRRCGATCCRRLRIGGSRGSPVACGHSTARRSIRNPQSVQWLTGDRVTLPASSTSDCTEPNLSQKLAATGYTHLLVRRDTADGRWFATHPRAGRTCASPRISKMDRCSRSRRTAGDLYGNDDGVLSARARCGVDVAMDGRRTRPGRSRTPARSRSSPRSAVEIVGVPSCAPHGIAARRAPCADARRRASRALYQIGPLTVPPGDHELAFHPADAPTVADDVINNGDRRRLSFAVGTWSWSVRGEQP